MDIWKITNTESNGGVTLIELIIVISIVGILVIALGISFQGWQGKYNVESQVKQIYVDLMNVRARAMQSNLNHFALFPAATSYGLVEDTNENNAPNIGAGDTVLPTFPKTVEYDMTIDGGGVPQTLSFSRRGLITPRITICVFTDFDGNGTSDFDPDYDCINVVDTRITMGKLTSQNAGACGEAICDAK